MQNKGQLITNNILTEKQWTILSFSTWLKLEILPAEKEETSTPEKLSSEAVLSEELSSVSTEEDSFRFTPAADASNLKS